MTDDITAALAALHLTVEDFPSLAVPTNIPNNLYFHAAYGGKIVHADSGCGKLRRSRHQMYVSDLSTHTRCTSCFGRATSREDLERATALYALTRLHRCAADLVNNPTLRTSDSVRSFISTVRSLRHVPKTGDAAAVIADCRRLTEVFAPIVGDVAAANRKRWSTLAAAHLSIDRMGATDSIRKGAQLSNLLFANSLKSSLGKYHYGKGATGDPIVDAIGWTEEQIGYNSYRLDVRNLPEELTVERAEGQLMEDWMKANWTAAVEASLAEISAEWQARTALLVELSDRSPDRLLAIWRSDRLLATSREVLAGFAPVGSNGVVVLVQVPAVVAAFLEAEAGKASVVDLTDVADMRPDALELTWELWDPSGSVKAAVKDFSEKVEMAQAVIGPPAEPVAAEPGPEPQPDPEPEPEPVFDQRGQALLFAA